MTATASPLADQKLPVGEPELPDILPPVKQRRGIGGFIYRHPTIAIGGLMLSLLILMAIFAPLLGTTDPSPTAIDDAETRRRRPSAAVGSSYANRPAPG